MSSGLWFNAAGSTRTGRELLAEGEGRRQEKKQ